MCKQNPPLGPPPLEMTRRTASATSTANPLPPCDHPQSADRFCELMTDERTLERLMGERAHVTELRRLERAEAAPEEVADRNRLILRLQEHLADTVRDLLRNQRTSPA